MSHRSGTVGAMAWDNPPPVDNAEITRRLLGERLDLRKRLATISKQLRCKHQFETTSILNLGGERQVDVRCELCDLIWY